MADQSVREDLGSIWINSPEQFFSYMLMDAAHVSKYVKRTSDPRLNTDDNAYLEYRTPFEFLRGTRDIVADLLPFAGWDVDKTLINATTENRQRIQEAWQRRLERVIPELADPID
jgi:hypothetical protein